MIQQSNATVKSEFEQIIEYINKNTHTNKNTHRKRAIIDNQSIQQNDNNITNHVENKSKIYFNSLNFLNSEKFKNAINNSLCTDINNELSMTKNFFTCSDIYNCHRKIFYEYNNYEYIIDFKYLSFYKNYIQINNFKNIILELLNFKKNNIFINYKNKIKDLISGIHDNVLIEFIKNPYLNEEEIFKSKVFIYNLDKNIDDKINRIKIIKFNNSFDDFDFTDLSCEFDIDLFSNRLEKLTNYLKRRVLPPHEKSDFCNICFYKNHCNIVKENKPINRKSKKLKPVVDDISSINNKFLL